MSEVPQWPYVLETVWGVKLSQKLDSSGQSEWQRWQEELSRDIGGLYDEDICEAIRMAADDRGTKRYGKPSVRDMRIWIFTLFKTRSGGRDEGDGIPENVTVQAGADCEHITQERTTMSALRQAIARAPDMDAMWIEICKPSNTAQCVVLEEYAKTVLPSFKRPDQSGGLGFTVALAELDYDTEQSQQIDETPDWQLEAAGIEVRAKRNLDRLTKGDGA